MTMTARDFLHGLAALALMTGQAAAAPLLCSIDRKVQCDRQGCVPGVIGVYPERRTYSRCDAKGSDDYAAGFTRSGVFIAIDVPGTGMVAKLSDTGGLVEIVTMGLVVLVSHGECRPE